MVLDAFAASHEITLRPDPTWEAELGKWHNMLLVKPVTFMNASGQAIGKLARFFKLDPASILIVYDDKDLPLGRLRLRASGSSGSHNGMASVITHLSSDRIPRLRVGIGGGSHRLRDHVLSKFTPEESDQLASAVTNAVKAIDCILEAGLATAMNQFNTKST